MPLSDAAIRRAKPTDKTQKLFDGFGLFLEITPAGGRRWRQKYRFGGKEKLLAHGTYPLVTLAEARERRDQARKLLERGIDPADHRKAEKAAGADPGIKMRLFDEIMEAMLDGKRLDGSPPESDSVPLQHITISTDGTIGFDELKPAGLRNDAFDIDSISLHDFASSEIPGRFNTGSQHG